MTVKVRYPKIKPAGELRFQVYREATKQLPERTLMSGTVIGTVIHWDTVTYPSLFPAELENWGACLCEIAVEARKAQAKQERKPRPTKTDGPPSDTTA